jgi:hypothetical protein
MRILILVFLLSFFPHSSYGDFYFEIGLEDGGETLSRIKYDADPAELSTVSLISSSPTHGSPPDSYSKSLLVVH